MPPAFRIWCSAPVTPEGLAAIGACLEAGTTVVADVFHPDPAREAERLGTWRAVAASKTRWPTRPGVRLSFPAAAELAGDETFPSPGLLILVGAVATPLDEAALSEWRRRGVALCWEMMPETPVPCDHRLLDAVVVRGYESGGVSQDRSVRTLFSAARGIAGELPLIVQGAGSPELAAVFLLLGAGGIILDAPLFRLPQVLLPEEKRRELARPREVCLRREPLVDGWADVGYRCPAEPEAWSLPVGPALFLCPAKPSADLRELTASFRQAVSSVTGRLSNLTTPDLDSVRGEPFLIQGPMAAISTDLPFAHAVSEAGFFPVLALTGLDAAAVTALGRATTADEQPLSYGLGATGRTGLTEQEVTTAFHGRPPAAIILAADQWPLRERWRATGIPLWLHLQNRAMLDATLAEGYTDFILEGGESGGHVGYLPGSVIWPVLLGRLREAAQLPADLHLILAGGIHDADSLLFGVLLHRAFNLPGSISFQMGTALLLSEESVTSGALAARYRETLVATRATAVLGPGSGIGVRAALTPRVRDLAALQGEPASAAVKAEVFDGYRRAVRGESDGLLLAGEAIAHLTRVRPLRDLAHDLASFGGEWERHRTAFVDTDTLDFRIIGPGPALDLAVVGLGGVFPGARGADELWELLRDNRRQIIEVPPEYWGPGDFRETGDGKADNGDRSYSWHAGMITDFTFDAFDSLRFHFPPRAVEVCDRIHLMILKAADQALEWAGAGFAFPSETTAVVIGNSMGGEIVKRGVLRIHRRGILARLEAISEYHELPDETRERIARELARLLCAGAPPITEDSLVGIASSTLGGRVAGYLNVFGGTFTVDAACASSLAALATAGEMLASGVADAAVVGGVDSDLTVDTFINFCRLRALAHGISRPFMEGSDGFTMGEGAGAIFLKPFQQALRDGDRIWARVTGWGLSSDGKAGSLTLPSVDGQELALRRAFARSGFAPGSIGFLETHGTGTQVGDAVELEALERVFTNLPPASIPLGSIKAHLGHLKSAAGIASLIKAVLALHHRTIPPAWIEGTLHPNLRKPGTPFFLPPRARPWARDGFMPRRAAVSAFGFGGSNAHVHLEEMDDRYRRLAGSRVLLFAGDDRDEVGSRVEALARETASRGLVDLTDPAQLSLLGGRGSCRLAAIWHTGTAWPTFVERLRATLRGAPAEDIRYREDCRRTRIVFLFPGQGSATQAPFRQLADSVAPFIRDLAGYGRALGADLAGALWPAGNFDPESPERFQDPVLQPATVALSLTLVRLLRELGVVPDAMAGHSLGFYTAMAAAGALPEAETLHLVSRRAACFEDLPPEQAGTMVAIFRAEEETRALLAGARVEVWPANFNSPRQTVLSVRRGDVIELERFLEERGAEHRRLQVGWGFHSPLVAPAAAAFRTHLDKLSFRRPWCRLYSEVTGEEIPSEEFDGRQPHWLPEHIIRPVRFARLLQSLARDGHAVFLEVGARGTLTRFVRDTVREPVPCCLTLDSSDADVIHHLHQVMAELWIEAGADLDLGRYQEVFAGHLRPVWLDGGRVGAGKTISTAPRGAAAAVPVAAGAAASGEDVVEDEIFLAVRRVIARHTGFEEGLVAREQYLQETLGVDSLKMLEIGVDLEKDLGLSLLGASFPPSLTVGGVVDLIRRHGEKSPPAVEPAIRRLVALRRVPLPAAPGRAVSRIALITRDQELSAAWRALRYGPVVDLEKSGSAGLPRVLRSLDPQRIGGLVYAAVNDAGPAETLLEQSFLPAWVLGHDFLPGVVENNSPDAVRFVVLTAAPEGGFGAALAGFSRSLQWEQPNLRCGHVTLQPGSDPREAAKLLRREAVDTQGPFTFVRYRDGERLVENLEQVDEAQGESIIGGDDVVLVTGGGRGITAEVILDLARGATPTWILVGSTDPDGTTPEAAVVRETLEKLRATGAVVHHHRCDLGDLQETARLVAQLRELRPAISGVVHGAGVIADHRIENKEAADFLRVLAVKAGSALVLERGLDLRSIRFWINFSSIVSLLGNPGQTDYAAANEFLNLQAERLSLKGVAGTKSILWGPWSDVGMAAGEQVRAAAASRGIALMTPREGIARFRAEMTDGGGPVVAYCSEPTRLAAPVATPEGGVWAECQVSGAAVLLTTRPFTPDDPLLRDHRIKGVPVVPGVMALELSAAGNSGLASGGELIWERVALKSLLTPRDGMLSLTLLTTILEENAVTFQGGDRQRPSDIAFAGTLRAAHGRPALPAPPAPGKLIGVHGGGDLYGERGLLFAGPLLRVLTEVRVSVRGARATLHDPALSFYADGPVNIPAALIDGLMQISALWCHRRGLGAFLPVGMEQVWWSGKAADVDRLAARVWPVGTEERETMAFDAVLRSAGRPLVIIRGLTMSRAAAAL